MHTHTRNGYILTREPGVAPWAYPMTQVKNFCCNTFSLAITLPGLTHSLPPTFNPPHHSLTLFSLSYCLCTHRLTLPLLSHIIRSPLPSGYCQIVLYFRVSGSTLL